MRVHFENLLEVVEGWETFLEHLVAIFERQLSGLPFLDEDVLVQGDLLLRGEVLFDNWFCLPQILDVVLRLNIEVLKVFGSDLRLCPTWCTAPS